jgi:hypothetical protein
MSYDSTLIGALEPDQLAAAKMRPYPRRNLGRGVVILLILLRVYVMIAIPVVAYAFVHALLAPQ